MSFLLDPLGTTRDGNMSTICRAPRRQAGADDISIRKDRAFESLLGVQGVKYKLTAILPPRAHLDNVCLLCKNFEGCHWHVITMYAWYLACVWLRRRELLALQRFLVICPHVFCIHLLLG